MRVLITGGTGFIGSRLALACLEAGESVRALGQSRSPVEAGTASLLRERGAEVTITSVTERGAMDELAQGVDVVYHLAAAQHEVNVPNSHFRAVNVEGTRNLLEASRAAGVARFVHGSTIGVFGWTQGHAVDEHAPLEPDNIYGRTKLEGEEMVRSYEGTVPVTTARIAEAYGPGDRRLLKLFRGVKRGAFLLLGGGRNTHHLVFIRDLVEALRRAARSESALGRTYVLAGPRPVTTREMAESAARALGVRPPRLGIPLAPLLAAAATTEAVLRPLGVQPPLHRRRMDFFRKSFAFSGEPARTILGWKPEVELEEGMRTTACWYREQGLL